MKNIYPFSNEGAWYKGNLHCHTTNSDGELPPEDVARHYKEKGYNFLALTDHQLFTNYKEFGNDEFIIVPATELEIINTDKRRYYHIVGIKADDSSGSKGFKHGDRFEIPKWKGTETPQNSICELNKNNNLAILAHPVWSLTELEDFKDLEGLVAVEVYNNTCEVRWHNGLSTVYWDSLLRRGKKIWGVAVDDAHYSAKDTFGGWIMVKCADLTLKSITDAIRKGTFYSSSGPEIRNFGVENGEAFVECSPVNAIHFVTYEDWGKSYYADEGKYLTSQRHKLGGMEKYVRVECIDKYGKTAWTNPIFLK